MKQLLLWVSICLLSFLTSCQQDQLSSFCKDATAESYSASFKVWCPSQNDKYFVPVRYGCPPKGQGISPPIAWSGIPENSTHLRIIVEDCTCTYECDSCCKFHHWVLDIPLSAMQAQGSISPQGIGEGASQDPSVQQFVLPNSLNKAAYMPFCPPEIQTHAYIYKLIAYKKENGKITIMGRAQSMPLLFSLNP